MVELSTIFDASSGLKHLEQSDKVKLSKIGKFTNKTLKFLNGSNINYSPVLVESYHQNGNMATRKILVRCAHSTLGTNGYFVISIGDGSYSYKSQ